MNKTIITILILLLIAVAIKFIFTQTHKFKSPTPYKIEGVQANNAEEEILLGTKINVNVATQRDLEILPGIGPSLASNIIERRDKLGDFKSIDQLTKVHGIGRAKLLKIRRFIDIE